MTPECGNVKIDDAAWKRMTKFGMFDILAITHFTLAILLFIVGFGELLYMLASAWCVCWGVGSLRVADRVRKDIQDKELSRLTVVTGLVDA